MPHRVDRGDDRIGRAQRTRIDVHLASAPCLERRVRRGFDVHIQQRGIGHIMDVSMLPNGIGDHRTHLVRRIARSCPHERQDKRAAREHRRVVGAQRKVGVMRIVRQHLTHRAAKEGHERRQGANGRPCHAVRMGLCLGQDAVDEGVCCHVRRYGMHDAVGDVLRGSRLGDRHIVDDGACAQLGERMGVPHRHGHGVAREPHHAAARNRRARRMRHAVDLKQEAHIVRQR